MENVKRSFKKVVGLMLAVAMVFTLNLTSLTANAASTSIPKPVSETAISVSGVTVSYGSDEEIQAGFYTDTYSDASYNDGGLKFIRGMYPKETEMDTLKNVVVNIEANSVTSADTTLNIQNPESGFYTFSADLLNKTHKVTINGTEYILVAGIKAGSMTPSAAGYVTSAQINKSIATITRTVEDNPCQGNPYYTENGKKTTPWTSVTNYIKAGTVAATTAESAAEFIYTVDGETTTTTVDISKAQTVAIGNYKYTVTATMASADEFVVNSHNFKIDFTEMEESEDPVADDDAIAKAEQISKVFTEYYKDASVNKAFPAGSTNMDVMQAILSYGVEKGIIDGSTTTLGSDVTYISQINGLGEFDVGYMSGWMYTDNPYQANTKPQNWYTAPIGAASYEMKATSTIAWFYTVDYTTHPW